MLERSRFVPSHIVFEVPKCLLVVLNGLSREQVTQRPADASSH
jgi:hypothetical protein